MEVNDNIIYFASETDQGNEKYSLYFLTNETTLKAIWAKLCIVQSAYSLMTVRIKIDATTWGWSHLIHLGISSIFTDFQDPKGPYLKSGTGCSGVLQTVACAN